jgi:integrase
LPILSPVGDQRKAKGAFAGFPELEATRLIQAAESEPRAPHLADFIRLALHTGMRKGEWLGLEWCRVGLKEGLIYLEPNHTKTGERRTVPLNGVAKAALVNLARFQSAHCPSSPWVFCVKRGERIQNVNPSSRLSPPFWLVSAVTNNTSH